MENPLKQNLLDPEDIERKLEKARIVPYKDVTVEELKKEWLQAAAEASRFGTPEAKEKSKEAKAAYEEAARKEHKNI